MNPGSSGMDRRPLLVAGAPRTGTTWIAEVLSRAGSVAWINEPDNEWPNTYALKAKRSLGRFPALTEGDTAPRYEELWRRSFAGFRQGRYQEALAWKLDRRDRTMQELWRAMCDHADPAFASRLRVLAWLARPPSSRDGANNVMVKSVHAPLALEWISARLRPRMLVVLRHPLNVVASWMGLGWGGCALHTHPSVHERFGERWGLPRLEREASQIQRLAWEVGLFTSALRDGVDAHADWIGVSHEDLCMDPVAGFRRLYEKVGFAWAPRVEAFLHEADQPGEGWSTYRVAAEQPERWRERLSPDQTSEIWSVLSRFRAPWVDLVARDLE